MRCELFRRLWLRRQCSYVFWVAAVLHSSRWAVEAPATNDTCSGIVLFVVVCWWQPQPSATHTHTHIRQKQERGVALSKFGGAGLGDTFPRAAKHTCLPLAMWATKHQTCYATGAAPVGVLPLSLWVGSRLCPPVCPPMSELCLAEPRERRPRTQNNANKKPHGPMAAIKVVFSQTNRGRGLGVSTGLLSWAKPIFQPGPGVVLDAPPMLRPSPYMLPKRLRATSSAPSVA